MPRPAQLPDSIQRLARLNAIEFSDRSWKAHLDRLAEVVASCVPAASPKPLGQAQPPRTDSATFRLGQVAAAAVRDAIASLPAGFQTKDVSEHPTVQDAHGDFTRARNYHAMIGKFIMRESQTLRVRALNSSDSRGMRWERITSASRSSETDDV